MKVDAQSNMLWQTKLAARLHDPIEKALILMRTTEGHEGGTSEILRRELGLTDLPARVRRAVQRADHWASAADRAAFPNRNNDGPYPAWQQVRFHERPVIIHPLTGAQFDLIKLSEIDPDQAKALALDHLRSLIHADDFRKSALAFWRFGPVIEAGEIKNLWAQLPADTRVPDHNIFDHLDLTAALASCFALDDGGPALLAVSLGPVQEFISASRSTSDLWAGSHLLARLAWEAMKVICDRIGPEAILFPRLRGVPQVDVWLRDTCGLDVELFDECEWTGRRSDANPLFTAALPNRFTALIPAGQAQELATAITDHVRQWVHDRSKESFRLLLECAGITDEPSLYGYQQISDQLDGFPEVHWVAVPWSLVESNSDGKVNTSGTKLRKAMCPFFENDPPGYLGGLSWKLLSGGLKLEEGSFWKPNPGTLYPALHELLERALASAKSMRPFNQTRQVGWRDSISGEAEWLTTDREHLKIPPGQRKDTLWLQVADNQPSWAKQGEHLSVLNTLKRMWPTLYVRELEDLLDSDVNRFVVSTHTMAIATSLAKAIKENRALPVALAQVIQGSKSERVALPRKLAETLRDHPDGPVIARIPGWLEAVHESRDDQRSQQADRLMKDYLGAKPEAYYGLLLMDGDEMGAWVSADPKKSLCHEFSFHPQIRAGLRTLADGSDFGRYAKALRAPSPSRHMAISEALNNFSLILAPEVAERHFHGRVLYAGGDDLMAMFPVIDLLPAMAELRAVYSGVEPHTMGAQQNGLGFSRQANGFVKHKGRLLRVMGHKATASCGAVVAHHQAPLGAVLRELRMAEHRAKEEGGRDAFCISIIKRSGGALRLVSKWGEAVRLLLQLQNFLADPNVSRRAVYNSCLWLRDLPQPEGDGAMVVQMLAYQLARQAGVKPDDTLSTLAYNLVKQALDHVVPDRRLDWIENFLSVAEFLARETRSTGSGTGWSNEGDAA